MILMSGVQLVLSTRFGGEFVYDPATGQASDGAGTGAPAGVGASLGFRILQALGLTIAVRTPLGSFGPYALTGGGA